MKPKPVNCDDHATFLEEMYRKESLCLDNEQFK